MGQPSTAQSMVVAQRWMSEPVRDFFTIEIDNERQGGTSPSTLSSAIDSLSQAPNDVVESWLGEEPASALIALLVLRNLLPGDTELRSLL